MAARARPPAKSALDPLAVLRASKAPDFRQERSRRSYLAILDAATALFSRRPYDDVGTPEIAERAGVAVGTFYRYFEDKHEVYLEVIRRSMRDAYEATLAGLTPARFVGLARHETISHAVTILFAHVLEHPYLSRSLLEMSLRDPDVAAIDRAFEQMTIARLTELISAVVPSHVVPDPEATAWVLYGAAMRCAHGLVNKLAPRHIDADRAKKALTAFIERTLFPDASTSR